LNCSYECIIQVFQLPKLIFQYLKISCHEASRTNICYKISIQLFNRLIGGVREYL